MGLPRIRTTVAVAGPWASCEVERAYWLVSDVKRAQQTGIFGGLQRSNENISVLAGKRLSRTRLGASYHS